MPRNLIVHLKGTSKSAKGTALRDLWEVSRIKTFIVSSEDNMKEAVYLRGMNTILIGAYGNACDGCGSIIAHGGLSRVEEIVRRVISDPEYDGMTIFLEALLMGSFIHIQRLYEIAGEYDSGYIVVHCYSLLEANFDKVSRRNNKKKSTQSINEKMEAAGIPLIVWDNSSIDKEDMLPELLNLVEDYILRRNEQVEIITEQLEGRDGQ